MKNLCVSQLQIALFFLATFPEARASDLDGRANFREQPVIRLRAARAFMDATEPKDLIGESPEGGHSLDRSRRTGNTPEFSAPQNADTEHDQTDQIASRNRKPRLLVKEASAQDSRFDDAMDNSHERDDDHLHNGEDPERSDRHPRLPGCVPGELDEADCADDQSEAAVSRFRESFFQGVSVSTGTVGSGDDDTLSIYHFQVSATGAIPLGSSENMTDNVLMITPGFRADYLDSPPLIDLPSELYEPSLTFFWRRVINERLSSSLIVTPSIRSDFTTSDNAFRMFGLALINWETIPDELWISAGGVYLDRSDLTALPVAGVTWKPTPVWKIDVQFPQPKVSYRLDKHGSERESWAYLCGAFGGNTWAVTRTGGVSDQLTLSDLRMVVGYEEIFSGNRGGFAEMGWAFDRKMEYAGLPGSQSFSDALVARVGISF